MMTEKESRKQFEAWVSSSPYDESIERYPNDTTKYGWPGSYKDIRVDMCWQAWQEARNNKRQPMTENRDLATTVLQVIRTLCNSPAITDTIWMPYGNVSAVEELCSVAAALGVSDDEIEEATQGDCEELAQ